MAERGRASNNFKDLLFGTFEESAEGAPSLPFNRFCNLEPKIRKYEKAREVNSMEIMAYAKPKKLVINTCKRKFERRTKHVLFEHTVRTWIDACFRETASSQTH